LLIGAMIPTTGADARSGEQSAAATAYTVQDLGVTAGAIAVYAEALNDNGQVAGSMVVDPCCDVRAFLWTAGTMKDLSVYLPRGQSSSASYATGISPSGVVSGGVDAFTAPNTSTICGFVLQGSRAQCGTKAYVLNDVNDTRTAVGHGKGPDVCIAAKSVKGRTVRLLPSFGECLSDAMAINASGQIVGQVEVPSGSGHAALWEGSSVRDLGTLGGCDSWATDINDAGMIVGRSAPAGQCGALYKGFRWSNGRMTLLPPLPGFATSHAAAVNSSGATVGHSVQALSNETRAVVWDARNRISDLNALLPPGSGWFLVVANDINASGQIVGTGVHDGQTRGFLLTPV
jgi:probable HAF family extracellular repeat protein